MWGGSFSGAVSGRGRGWGVSGLIKGATEDRDEGGGEEGGVGSWGQGLGLGTRWGWMRFLDVGWTCRRLGFQDRG